jgi:SSS family solute:Na+ symporter
VVLLSILWIPMIRYLSGEVYQYMQSVQAYIGAPITATFVLGILWRGGTSRAAISTLILGGLAGAGRFLLDILYKAYGMDLGPLNGLVQVPFLNYSVGVFVGCLALFWAVSKLDEKPVAARIAGLTFDWERRRTSADKDGNDKLLGWLSTAVGLAVLMLWFNFR